MAPGRSTRICKAAAASACLLLILGSSPAAWADGGRPRIVLDRLEFPAMIGAKKYRRHLTRALQREAATVNWGASGDSTIEYRFAVRSLKVLQRGDVLSIDCDAVGSLPGGRTAKSRLNFGGDPRNQSKLIRHVLGIVARGVVTRLAEMERVRRGNLPDRDVPTPEHR